MKTKKCTKCGELKKSIEFSKHQQSKDGYYPSCKVCNKKYYENNKSKISKYYKKRYIIIKDKMKQKYIDNKEKILERTKNKYQKNRRKSDIKFKLTCNLRNRLSNALYGLTKHKSTLKLMGCSIEFLKQHLQKQFKDGMTWDNYGYSGWHIDHIKPCTKFDLSKEAEQNKCFNYINLQPLWAGENFRKGGMYESR